jgi:hypothetical protein
VKEERLLQRKPELELRDAAFLLIGVRGVVAIEIQAALADRHAGWVSRQVPQRSDGVRFEIFGVVRMNAGCERQTELRRLSALLDRRAGDDDLRYARFARAREYSLQVVAKSGVGEIGADINHCETRDRPRFPAKLPVAAILACGEKRGLSLILEH